MKTNPVLNYTEVQDEVDRNWERLLKKCEAN